MSELTILARPKDGEILAKHQGDVRAWIRVELRTRFFCLGCGVLLRKGDRAYRPLCTQSKRVCVPCVEGQR